MLIAKALLVDDDASARESAGRSLRSALDCLVVEASSVAEGLRRADESMPDVILLDDSLPGLDLPAFLAEVCKHQLKPLPAVILLGNPDQPRPAGAAGVLARPLDPERFPRELLRLVELSRLSTQLAKLEQLGGPDFIEEMITLFLGQATAKVGEIRQALETGDCTVIARIVHTLKSSAANLGVEVLRRLLEELEMTVAQGELEKVSPLLPRLEQEWERSRGLLEQARRQYRR
jgi:two-component system sensor histidine kinase RpfC